MPSVTLMCDAQPEQWKMGRWNLEPESEMSRLARRKDLPRINRS
jgi:hypothetical protein